ncbi:MAG: hypothetical protein HY907_23050 [Deltaproteobacteria bacterium]|nr:hypothetical protein [Deltaproteobacteria bacterium]
MSGRRERRIGHGWRWAVAILAFFLLGTSRPLESKELVAAAGTAPPGLTIVTPARAVFGENVNNQGCCSRQWADLALKIDLRNDGTETVRLDQGAAEVLVDGAPHRMSQLTYSVGNDPPQMIPFETYDLAPGETRTVRLLLNAFLPSSAIRSVRRLELRWPAADGMVVATFENLDELDTTTSGPRPGLWY